MKSTRAERGRMADLGDLAALTIRSSREFANLFEPSLGEGGVFYPTRKKLAVGAPVTIRVRLGRRQPSMLLYGKVAWRRPGRHLEKVRAGLGVELSPVDRPKVEYLLEMARASGGGLKSRRRHERVPVDLPVSWKPLGAGEDLEGRLRDVGRGGAFVRSGRSVASDDQVVLQIAPPGAAVPMAITARIAWIDASGEEPGFGVEWRARDAGGGRRIRELVRRLIDRPALHA